MPKRAKAQQEPKNSAASAFGRLGGLKGGPARMAQLSAEERSALGRKANKARTAALTPAERSEQARKAVLARWSKRKTG